MDAAEPIRALRRHFGFAEFREPQQAIIRSVLDGRDTLVVMPTGGGKSLCYQLPAMLLPDVTVVVSPLIALMKDQVDALVARGIPAGMVNSAQGAEEQREVFRRVREGGLRLVYIAPERFRSRYFTDMLAGVRVSLFAVDEAHCLSQWGHDFRPDYLRLANALGHIGRPPVVALTATATPDVRADIVTQLALRDPALFISGFARKNLHFTVNAIAPNLTRGGDSLFAAKIERVSALVREHRTGIVYCATRKSVERVSEALPPGRCVAYHGGMDDTARTSAQERFMRGEIPVAVATNAFGMGIDRADIRFVAHFEMPGSVEAYYQEAGRAGRDGRPAHCEMLFNYSDRRVQEFFLEGTNPGRDTLDKVNATLWALADAEKNIRCSIDELGEKIAAATRTKINPMAVGTALTILARHRVIERFDIPGQRIRGTRLLLPGSDTPLDINWETLSEKRRRDESKLEAVIQYAYTRICRQRWILGYFGETGGTDCDLCDTCASPGNAQRRVPDDAELLLVRKALSGLARMCERVNADDWQPRFGRQRVIDCLLGKDTEDIRKARLNALSTHGILRDETRAYLTALFGELEREGLVQGVEKATADGKKLPLLALTKAGAQVMRGETTFKLEWPGRGIAGTPPRGRRERADTAPAPARQKALLTKLRNYRAVVAKKSGNTPPYIVLHKAGLEALAQEQPLTIDDALKLPGITTRNLRVLPAFLDIIRRHREEHNAP
ncbi:MAG: ATP-dependent DNA helicase [Puniceicoccales bacterium]|jgi:ATP-dependent DNA helicase RecQ|nr:ATP-dependent DNA helicase [Puniceicoccales bacterium]